MSLHSAQLAYAWSCEHWISPRNETNLACYDVSWLHEREERELRSHLCSELGGSTMQLALRRLDRQFSAIEIFWDVIFLVACEFRGAHADREDN